MHKADFTAHRTDKLEMASAHLVNTIIIYHFKISRVTTEEA